jgi:hypothetical protein
MNGGQACRTTGETTSRSFHADVRGLCGGLAPSEPPPSSGRSEAVTLPYADPFADTLAASSTLGADRPHWCVDTGVELATMTTFELWEALERGQVLAWMRVWREGMECWTPVGEIAEFAWAIAGTPAPPPGPELLPDPEASADATLGPLSAPTSEPPPESAIRPTSRSSHGARWVALGSVVAVTAVASAIFVQHEPPPPPPVVSAGAAPPSETPPPEYQPEVLHEDKPIVEAARHEERGQHRLPRGGRRSYGR